MWARSSMGKTRSERAIDSLTTVSSAVAYTRSQALVGAQAVVGDVGIGLVADQDEPLVAVEEAPFARSPVSSPSKGSPPGTASRIPGVGRNMTREDAIIALLGIGVPADVAGDLPELPSEVEGLLVYGSRARGDALPGSDLDVLALVTMSRPSIHSGDVNASCYTRQQLSTGIGTLFGAHLKRDAKILWDDQGHLTRAVENMGEVDTARLIARARSMSVLFTSLERDLPKYLRGLLRQARYLLRSCLYAQAIADGNPCFSVRELAVRHGDPHLARLLASRQSGEADVADLEDCLSRLEEAVGEFPPGGHGSLEATVVNEWGRPGDVLSMAFMALGAANEGSDYAEVEKILL